MFSSLLGKEPALKPVIEHMLKANPYVPFRMHLTSRTHVDVLQPALVEVCESVMKTYVVDENEPDKRRMTWLASVERFFVKYVRAKKRSGFW